MKILLVHGRNEAGRNPKQTKGEWLVALAQGCAEAGIPAPDPRAVALPFFGDRLAALVAAANVPLANEIAQLGPDAVDPAYLKFRSSIIEEICTGAGITDAQIKAELPDEGAERNPADHGRVHAMLQALDKNMPRMTEGALEHFVRDVWVYLTVPGVRDGVDSTVTTGLGPEPTVVVGYSLGSVVSYSLLRRVHSHEIPRLVTLGSPLGLSAIRNHFRPLKFPDGVADWFNAYDERDLVALRGLGSEVFPVEPPIRNDHRIDNQTRNCHGVTGYLNQANVAKAICCTSL